RAGVARLAAVHVQVVLAVRARLRRRLAVEHAVHEGAAERAHAAGAAVVDALLADERRLAGVLGGQAGADGVAGALVEAAVLAERAARAARAAAVDVGLVAVAHAVGAGGARAGVGLGRKPGVRSFVSHRRRVVVAETGGRGEREREQQGWNESHGPRG